MVVTSGRAAGRGRGRQTAVERSITAVRASPGAALSRRHYDAPQLSFHPRDRGVRRRGAAGRGRRAAAVGVGLRAQHGARTSWPRSRSTSRPQAAFAHPKAGTEITPNMIPSVSQYAGQQLLTGQQAEAYADHFIAVHITEIGGGKTYSQLSAESMAAPNNTKLAGLVATVFKGETLRSMLLNAYGWWKVSQITYIASLVAFGLAGLAFLVSLGGLTGGPSTRDHPRASSHRGPPSRPHDPGRRQPARPHPAPENRLRPAPHQGSRAGAPFRARARGTEHHVAGRCPPRSPAPSSSHGRGRDDLRGGDRAPAHPVQGNRPAAERTPDQRDAGAEAGPGSSRRGERKHDLRRRGGRDRTARPAGAAGGRPWRVPKAASAATPTAAQRRRPPGYHHRSRRDHPGRGTADEHAPRQRGCRWSTKTAS